MATTLMDQYMKMTGTAFVHTAVEGVITKIMEMKQSCEVSEQNNFPGTYQAVEKRGHLHKALSARKGRIFQKFCTCVLAFDGRFVSFQINPACLENPADVEVNVKHLINILNETVNAIFKSTDACPPLVNPDRFMLLWTVIIRLSDLGLDADKAHLFSGCCDTFVDVCRRKPKAGGRTIRR